MTLGFISVLGETLEEVLKWGITLQTVKMTQEAVVKRNTGKSPLPAVLQAAEHSAGKNLVEGQDRIRVLVAPIPAPKIEDIGDIQAVTHRMKNERNEAAVADHGNEGNPTDHDDPDQEAEIEVQDLTIDIDLTVTAVSTRTAAEVTVEAGLTKGRDAKEETKGGRRSGRKEKIGNREVIRKGILETSN